MILWERRQGRNRRQQSQQCLWREGNVGWEDKNERKGPRASQNRPESEEFQLGQHSKKWSVLFKHPTEHVVHFHIFFFSTCPSPPPPDNWSTEPCLYLFCLLNRISKLREVEAGLRLSCQRIWKTEIIRWELSWELKSEWLLRFVLFVTVCKQELRWKPTLHLELLSWW